MSEFLLELYSEEIPSNLQIAARKELKLKIQKSLEEESLKYETIFDYSCPTRLTIYIKGLPDKLKILSKEIRGPKVGVLDDILNRFIMAHNVTKKEVFEKETDKGNFYFVKTKAQEVLAKDILIKVILNSISSLNWKKSMKWSDTNLIWGRPLRSILAIYNKKLLQFNYGHLRSTETVLVEQDIVIKYKKVKSFFEYQSFLKSNEIILDQDERKTKIINRFEAICKSKGFKEFFNNRLLEEVINIVDNPNILVEEFNKDYLKIPQEIIISTLENQQKYFPLFDNADRLTNSFLIVANKSDKKNLIKKGNKRVVEARLSDAKFFWDKDKSKNLIKQIGKLKTITFYDKLGTIYDKTQRLRKLASMVSDQLNINKEKIEVAASISKSDLCSDLVGEYPELQGTMGKYFALSQGFEEDIANSISEHYLPIGLTSTVPKKPISYSISVVDRLDTLVGFFSINETPTSSKDPFALRRSAIGLLRILVENKLNMKLKDLINYSITLFKDQGVKIENENTEREILNFFKERMRNILKEKNIKNDIIEASISSHTGDNYLDLLKKSVLMNRYINKDIGKNAIYSYKRASNILDNEKKEILGKPDAVLFRKDEEKSLFEKINEIRRAFTVQEDDKNYENLLIQLAEIKSYTDNFFDNVVVNDENHDIKNNRLELLKMFCKTFNSFIDFSKLEGA
ncbi:MAG: glycine--tRNA ligase subunit beta [Pelagibacterales bacterium MED-G40]|nr:MAG: glycine--tRNA ligase subunit beta [Pelagibacterales bacterium MED-G40]|tara:strand:+ start:13101 stop:15155 length:2055 start_codon:yes stop_codon:yes gene_type:complete